MLYGEQIGMVIAIHYHYLNNQGLNNNILHFIVIAVQD